MKPLILASFIILLSTTANATWTKAEITKEAAFIGLQVIDGLQTNEIFNNPDYYELNPILTEDNFIWVMGATLILHPIITHHLPRKKCEKFWCLNKSRWQNITLGFKAGLVVNNFSIGIRF